VCLRFPSVPVRYFALDVLSAHEVIQCNKYSSGDSDGENTCYVLLTADLKVCWPPEYVMITMSICYDHDVSML
jgi:hypothetical protein